MSRSTYITLGSIMLIGIFVNAVLLIKAESPSDSNILRLSLTIQIGFFIFKLFQLLRFKGNSESQPLPNTPKTKPYKLPKFGPINTRAPYIHQPTEPKRRSLKRAQALNISGTKTQRQVILPTLPSLRVPSSGRSNTRTPEPVHTPAPKPKPRGINIRDVSPPNTSNTQPSPKPPEVKPTSGPRVKCPKKYSNFKEKSSELPAKISLSDLQVCSDILTLGYYCAASDGSISSQEDDYLKAWAWCVIEKTSDSDSHLFHKALSDIQSRAINDGKKKLNVISELADRIRGTGEKKFIQCAGYLCTEVVECDGRLELGEFPTLSTALKHLGIRNIKAQEIAEELLFNDDEISELKSELDIDEYTTTSERESILSREWSKLNGRMNAVRDISLLEEMKRRMGLIQKIRDLYREIEAN
jgi:hypothetical protein